MLSLKENLQPVLDRKLVGLTAKANDTEQSSKFKSKSKQQPNMTSIKKPQRLLFCLALFCFLFFFFQKLLKIIKQKTGLFKEVCGRYLDAKGCLAPPLLSFLLPLYASVIIFSPIPSFSPLVSSLLSSPLPCTHRLLPPSSL